MFLFTLNTSAQECFGNACGSVKRYRVEPYKTSTEGIKNLSSKKVKIRYRVVGMMTQGLEWEEKILEPYGELKSISGFASGFHANFVEEYVPPAPPQSITQQIRDGNYRLKNVASGKYLKVTFEDRLLNTVKPKDGDKLKFIARLSCDLVEAKDEAAKWSIKNIRHDKEQESYYIGTKYNNNFVLCKKDSSWYKELPSKEKIPGKKIDFNGEDLEVVSILIDKGQADKIFLQMVGPISELGIESKGNIQNTASAMWVFQKAEGSNNFRIKNLNFVYFIYEGKKEIKLYCDEILGEPSEAIWHIEECQ